MSRLTYELGHKGSGSYEPIQNKDMPANNYIACINKLGQLENLLEKYGIPSLKYLEKCIIDHDKYGELGEQIGCPLEVVFKAVKNGIYAIDLPNENKLKYIPTLTLLNIETEWYLSNHCDFCVNVRDYKTLYWLKEDRSE